MTLRFSFDVVWKVGAACFAAGLILGMLLAS